VLFRVRTCVYHVQAIKLLQNNVTLCYTNDIFTNENEKKVENYLQTVTSLRSTVARAFLKFRI